MIFLLYIVYKLLMRGRRKRMVIEFTKKNYAMRYVLSSNPGHDEVYSIQHYMIKLVSDLRQVGRLLTFPPPIKLTTTIKNKYR